MELITSLQNSRIKNVCLLSSKASERKQQQLFVLEGAREISLAIAGNYQFESVFICPELFDCHSREGGNPLIGIVSRDSRLRGNDSADSLCGNNKGSIFEVSEAVFQKIAYREGSDGILAVARPKSHNLSDLQLPDNPFVIVLEAVEKPGNLGAILRTADAAKADAVIVCDPTTDIYNPNVVRSSVGCLFTVPVAVCSNAGALTFLKNKHIRTFAAELTAAQWYQDTDFTTPSAVIMGTEADGLTDFWLKNADARIKIPMRGVIDSLNVSVSTAILTFEAMRQRGF
ncbi:MAG: RNA methyltransferase [Candidatus Symbiothrix sp.]|jgi:TrmH family RNA methyltransferase|nr:RNA methyltransferase [Candidatus Symbiothrix sp.]